MDDYIIKVEAEGTVLPGHAEHKVAAEETHIEECTPQNGLTKIPKVRTSEDPGRSISLAAGDENCKSFGKSSAGELNPVLKIKLAEVRTTTLRKNYACPLGTEKICRLFGLK